MNDTVITFRGYAGTDVRHRETPDATVASVRVASTPRVRRNGTWVDGPTTWYSVTAWRSLADHLRDSVRKGDPLVVHGRLLRSETWAPEGAAPSTTLEVEAFVVGHDLNRGISHFIKAKRPETASQDGASLGGKEPVVDEEGGPEDEREVGPVTSTERNLDTGGSGQPSWAA
jgi:single-strand DNA-binding protein